MEWKNEIELIKWGGFICVCTLCLWSRPLTWILSYKPHIPCLMPFFISTATYSWYCDIVFGALHHCQHVHQHTNHDTLESHRIKSICHNLLIYSHEFKEYKGYTNISWPLKTFVQTQKVNNTTRKCSKNIKLTAERVTNLCFQTDH